MGLADTEPKLLKTILFEALGLALTIISAEEPSLAFLLCKGVKQLVAVVQELIFHSEFKGLLEIFTS